MIRKEDVYKIGVINKPHGIHGELSFTFTDDIFDRVESDYILCLLDGILVPFFFEEYRFTSDTTVLIKLEGIDTAECARLFTNVEVYFPKELAEQAEPDGQDNESWGFLTGYHIEDAQHGDLGEIIEVDETTINSLFVVDHDGTELLIPTQGDFIKSYDFQNKVVRVNLPDGMLDLDKAEEV